MTQSKRFAMAIILIFILVVRPQAQTPASYPYLIQWESIQGAGGYSIEVQTPTEEFVFSKDVSPETHQIELKLPAGRYRIRIVTLNKFHRFENATDWEDIEILSYSAPVFKNISPAILLTNTPVSLTLNADRVSLNVNAVLLSPTGKQIKLTLKKISTDVFRLSGPALTERGPYALILTNPPALTTRKDNLLTVQYPEPTISQISPNTFDLRELERSEQPLSFEVTGTQFSPEVSLELAAVDNPEKTIPVQIITTTANTLTVIVSGKLAEKDYALFIANDSITPKKPGPILTISKSAAPAKEKTPNESPQKKISNLLVLGSGIQMDIAMGEWESVYSAPSFSGYIYGDYYFDEAIRPSQGHSLDFSLGLRSEFFKLSNSGTGKYVESHLTAVSLLVSPAVTLSFPFLRIKYFLAAGLNYFALESALPPSGKLNESTINGIAMTGLSFEYPLGDKLALGLANQFTYIAHPSPFYKYSVSLVGSYIIPVWR